MSWGAGDVIDREDEVYCRGVYGFTDRLKVAIQSRNVNFVKDLSRNMETCFRGEALRWWNDEVNTLTRRGLLHADTMDEWSQVLEKRFKTPPGQAWSNLDNTRYTLADVRGKRSVSAYMSSLVSAAKQCGETQEYPMVLRAWKHLDLPLRRTIDEPIEGTTIKTFMELLVMKQSTWVDGYKQRQDIRQHVHELQPSCDNTPPIPGRSIDDTHLFDATCYAPTYPETSSYPQQITDRAALISPLNSSSLDDRAQEAPKLPDQTRSHPEPDVETEYFDDEFEDESFNSTASAYTCNICHSDFGSNNKLHTHIRAHSEDDSVQAEAYIATPTDLPLIESTASPTHTPGYAFRSWQYAAAQTLTAHGISEAICLDTGCTMTLIDKEFLLGQDPDVDIHKRPTEITVRSSGYRVSVSVSEYVTVALHLIAKKVKIKQHHVLPRTHSHTT